MSSRSSRCGRRGQATGRPDRHRHRQDRGTVAEVPTGAAAVGAAVSGMNQPARAVADAQRLAATVWRSRCRWRPDRGLVTSAADEVATRPRRSRPASSHVSVRRPAKLAGRFAVSIDEVFPRSGAEDRAGAARWSPADQKTWVPLTDCRGRRGRAWWVSAVSRRPPAFCPSAGYGEGPSAEGPYLHLP